MAFSSGVIGAISAVIIVPIVFALFSKIKVLRHVPNSTKDFRLLKKEYGNWEKLSLVLLIFFATTIGLALWKSFIVLANFKSSQFDYSKFVIYQPSIALAIPSLFLAILLSGIPIHFLYLWLLGPTRYAEYTEYENQKSGIDYRKLFRYIACVIIPSCIIFTFLVLDSYVNITALKIRVNSFFDLYEREYSFEEIAFLKHVKSFKAPNGNIVHKPYFIIGFTDGSNFNFHRTLHEISIKEQEEILQFISSKSKQRIQIDDPFPH